MEVSDIFPVMTLPVPTDLTGATPQDLLRLCEAHQVRFLRL
ncbi:MAG: hypothetical protein RLZZ25_1305, partial [Gemmatimonadota bacterium]